MRRRPAVQQAFDEARFGHANILNVRDAMPTGAEAAVRAEGWLRTRQVDRVGEVLIITGRGSGSPGQVPVVREEIRKLLTRLRRAGVVREFREHTPGSFAVTLAPLRALFDAPRRQRDRPAPGDASGGNAPTVAGLDEETSAQLFRLAERSLESLGVRHPAEGQVRSEMERQFSLLVRGHQAMQRPDDWLRSAIGRAMREYEDSEP